MRRLCIDCNHNENKARKIFEQLKQDTTRHADLQEWFIGDTVYWFVGYFTKGERV